MYDIGLGNVWEINMYVGELFPLSQIKFQRWLKNRVATTKLWNGDVL